MPPDYSKFRNSPCAAETTRLTRSQLDAIGFGLPIA